MLRSQNKIPDQQQKYGYDIGNNEMSASYCACSLTKLAFNSFRFLPQGGKIANSRCYFKEHPVLKGRFPKHLRK